MWIIIHHTLYPLSKDFYQFQAVNSWHRKRWEGKTKSSLGYYGGYHYLISGDGKIQKFREENEVGAHCKQKLMNYRSIGICLAGNFDVDDMPKEQARALVRLVKKLQTKYKIPDKKVVGHRYYAPKSCPGKLLPDPLWDYFQNLAGFEEKWETKAKNWATKHGVSNGERPLDLCTRVEVWEMIRKFNNTL